MKRTTERGYIIIGVMFLLAVGLGIAASMLNLSASGTKTRAIVKTHAEYQYECEQTLNKAVAWLQENSKNIVSAFSAANFPANFVLGAPASGDNEGEFFEVPTMVKLAGTNNSAMLSNNSYFGVPAFPATTNIDSGQSFNPVAAFQSADLGSANARIIMMWARATDGNYEPVFRVDAVTGNNPDRGAHMFTYVYTQIQVDNASSSNLPSGIGFYSENFDFETKTGNNICYSYAWTHNGASWNKGAPRSNCVVASKHEVELEGKINGNALSLVPNGVHVLHPNGEVSGTICGGPTCHNYSITPFPSWATTCAGASQGNITLTSNMSLSSGPALNQQCWDTITINSNKALTLTDKVNPYRFKTLDFKNNSNSQLLFPAMLPGEKITIYVDNFAAGQLNGNQFVNTNNAPSNVQINITSASDFLLNGTADMYGYFLAPASIVDVKGTFNFHGAIHASQVKFTGNGKFNYDEGLALGIVTTPTLSDMAFTLNKASQRYR